MIDVDFTESSAGPAKSAPASSGTRLLDLCDEARAPVRFDCRAARCTTCRVEVLEGEALLEPPAPEEAALLASIHAPPHVRLACQVILRDSEPAIADADRATHAPADVRGHMRHRLHLRWIGPLPA